MRALDPGEGPTVWIDQSKENDFTYEIVVGTDPEDPSKRVLLSKDEIERAYGFIQRDHGD